MLRELDSYQLTFNDLNINLPEIDIISYKLTEKWPFINKSIGEIDFRNRFSLTIIAIIRGEKRLLIPLQMKGYMKTIQLLLLDQKIK